MQFHNKTAYVLGLRYRWDPSLSMNPVRSTAHFMPPCIIVYIYHYTCRCGCIPMCNVVKFIIIVYQYVSLYIRPLQSVYCTQWDIDQDCLYIILCIIVHMPIWSICIAVKFFHHRMYIKMYPCISGPCLSLCILVYDSLSDVGESRVCFASKNLTPCRMHWNDFPIAQIKAECHTFPNMYDML